MHDSHNSITRPLMTKLKDKANKEAEIDSVDSSYAHVVVSCEWEISTESKTAEIGTHRTYKRVGIRNIPLPRLSAASTYAVLGVGLENVSGAFKAEGNNEPVKREFKEIPMASPVSEQRSTRNK
jgi:hypothetical protein